jgi:probable FeS assembly SUF system protein SufT
MTNPEIIKLQRDCPATQVPFGNEINLPSGTEVTVTQALGGSYTVVANNNMYRINSSNADALGKTEPSLVAADSTCKTIEDKVWAALRTCYDPEIPVNIVDLGLVYGVDITPTDADKCNVIIRMTLTAPGCGMGPIIAADAQQKVASLPEVANVEIAMVFDPPWSRSMMSEQAQLELGLL